MGGPGGFGRGGGRPGQSNEEREAERKRRMEERKYTNTESPINQFAYYYREETVRCWTHACWSQKEEEGCRAVN